MMKMNSLYPPHRRYSKQKSDQGASTTYGGKALDRTFLYCFEIIKRNKGGFYCHENNVKVKVAVKFIDNQTKTT